MSRSIKELGVVVGYKCSFKCAHCCTGHGRTQGLSPEEILAVISAINLHAPRSLLFVGGETTLYLDTINEILSAANNLSHRRVSITTNGYFARSERAAVAVLLAFRKLDSVQLSYDKFHAEFLPFENVVNLYAACRKLELKFCVINTIASPMDLVGLKKLEAVGNFKILVNKVMAAGMAARNGIEYCYPSFNKNVLRRRCPARHKLVYVCGRGFSICCSNLAFDTDLPVAHATIAEHMRSKGHQMLVGKSFGQLSRMSGLNPSVFPPSFSSECVLCEYLFRRGGLLA